MQSQADSNTSVRAWRQYCRIAAHALCLSGGLTLLGCGGSGAKPVPENHAPTPATTVAVVGVATASASAASVKTPPADSRKPPKHAATLTAKASRLFRVATATPDDEHSAKVTLEALDFEDAPHLGEDQTYVMAAVRWTMLADGSTTQGVVHWSDLPPAEPVATWLDDNWRMTVYGANKAEARITVALDFASAPAKSAISTRVVASKNTPASLPGNRAFVMESHGHKHVMAGGPSSPLLVEHHYQDGKGRQVPAMRLALEQDNMAWNWRDLAFEVERHQYDRSMTLQVRSRELRAAVAAP